MWLLVGQAHSPHTRLRLAVSPGTALSERHLACPPQPPLYKDFITWLKEGIAMSPGSPARSGLTLDDMHIAAVAVVTESSSIGPVAEESGRGLWRGLTRAGRGGASGSRGGAVVVASRAGTVDRGARFIGDVTQARVVEGARDLALHAIARPGNARLIQPRRLGAQTCPTPPTHGHCSLLRLEDSKRLVRGNHQALAVIEAGGPCAADVVCARAEQQEETCAPRLLLLGARGGKMVASIVL